MLWLPTCHFMSHLLQHLPMTALILLGFLFHVIWWATVPIFQQRFKFLFTHFQSIVPFAELFLSPLTSLADHFSSLFPHIQVHVSSAFASASFLYKNVCTPKRRESGRYRYLSFWKSSTTGDVRSLRLLSDNRIGAVQLLKQKLFLLSPFKLWFHQVYLVKLCLDLMENSESILPVKSVILLCFQYVL